MQIREPVGGHRRLTQLIIGVAALLMPIAFAAEAQAATISVDRPCYVDVGARPAAMTVSGTGFTAGDTVNIASNDGTADATATADGNGNILITTAAPNPFLTQPGAKTQTLTAQDFTAAGTTVTATATVTSTSLAVSTTPSQARLTSKVTWRFSGFKPGALIYGHYLRKRQVARARFGRAKGPCGLLKTRARFYPGGHPRYSKYKLQIDNARHYSKHSLPRFLVTITKTVL